jgi:site-specific recombinase XerD
MGYYSKRKYKEGFKRWLEMLNYVQPSIDYDPKRLGEFLDWMEANGATQIEQITGSKVKEYFEFLSERKSKRTGEVLSVASLRSHLTTVNRFVRYLQHIEEGNIEVSIQLKGKAKKEIVVLSTTEIEQIYESTDDSLLGIRDRALLSIFYGCGVRRNEAQYIEVKDILPDRNLLYIRKGKGYKERYVPIVGKVKKDLINYLNIGRSVMVGKEINQSLFIKLDGKPLTSSGMYCRIKKLMKKAGIKKKAGLHTLRHSIATHLLNNGMKLSEIAKFLGHSSLESTQIYTHLKDETD